MSELTIITNNVPRDLIDAWELSSVERAEFDYLDWDAIERGEDSASFFRYKGTLYDLGDGFERVPDSLADWDSYQSDSFFSGIVIRYPCDNGRTDFERVIVGWYYS